MDWKSQFNERILAESREIIKSGKYDINSSDSDSLYLTVHDAEDYEVKITKNSDSADMECNCAYGSMGINCIHKAVGMYIWVNTKEEEILTKEEKAETKESNKAENKSKAAPKKIYGIKNISDTYKDISLNIGVNDTYCFALQQNKGIPLVKNLSIENKGENAIGEVSVLIETDTELILPYYEYIDVLEAGETYKLKNVDIATNAKYLMGIDETLICNLKIEVKVDEDIVICKYEPIKVLPCNFWPGDDRYSSNLLAAFILPNQRVVSEILTRASQFLNELCGETGLSGYQQNETHVKLMANAIFLALQEKNITYVETTPSFEDSGQKIRFADEIINFHKGNCMDLTLLYLACLEAIGLDTIAILSEGHIYSGFWLEGNGSLGDYYTRDYSLLKKLFDENRIIVVETTMVCSDAKFEEAIDYAYTNLSSGQGFQEALNIKSIRRSGVRALPIIGQNASNYVIDVETKDVTELIDKDIEEIEKVDLSDVVKEKKKYSKTDLWEQKLLDLSTKNVLVNTKVQAVVPLLCGELDDFCTVIEAEDEFDVINIPQVLLEKNIVFPCDIAIRKKKPGYKYYESIGNIGSYGSDVIEEISHRHIPSLYLNEKELQRQLSKIYKEVKSSMDETGTNPLFLTMGLLRWYEPLKKKQYYAPILMVPIDIKKSAGSDFSFIRRDDEIIINVTLVELLREQFSIDLYGLDPLPQKGECVDVNKVMAIIRDAIEEKENWDVIECGLIGIFSFGQFIMWNDVHSHPEFLMNNKLVNAIMNGDVSWDDAEKSAGKKEETYLAVPVDDSQLNAVKMAASNQSFILYGPPGTGKSQTITAMIANAMCNGKKVLFVAEKEVALDIVKNRLNAIGIGDFCLEIFSNKASKKSVIEQLRKPIELSMLGFSTYYEEEHEKYKEKKKKLDRYVIELHKIRKCGLSVYKLINLYESIEQRDIKFDVVKQQAGSITVEELNENKELIEEYLSLGKRIDEKTKEVFSQIYQTEYSNSLKEVIEEDIFDLKRKLKRINEEFTELNEYLGGKIDDSFNGLMSVYEIIDAIDKFSTYPTFLRDRETLENKFEILNRYIATKNRYVSLNEKMTSCYRPEFLAANMDEYKERYELASKKLLLKQKAVLEIEQEINSYAIGTPQIVGFSNIVETVKSYQELKEEYIAEQAIVEKEWLGCDVKNIPIENVEGFKNDLLKINELLEKYSELFTKLSSDGQIKETRAKVWEFAAKLTEVFEQKDKVYEALKIEETKKDQGGYIQRTISLCEEIEENASSLREWIAFRKAESGIKAKNLDEVCMLLDEGIEEGKIIEIYFKAVYKALIFAYIKESDELNTFSGVEFDKQIEAFKELDEVMFSVTKEEIFYKVSHNLPTVNAATGKNSQKMNGLIKAVKSKGRGYSIRSLLMEYLSKIQYCCPCFLMSPLSVAQYLEPTNDLFDLVVFDEASQLETCKAVGVIARGKNAVIVGDPKQMPPTNFFASNYFDEENATLEDLESILDECMTLGMPETNLKWHYRSRHESLIAFSNNTFYDNDMYTFPSFNDAERKVNLVKVNGFKANNRNEKEAARLVEEIVRRVNDDKLNKFTMGVVTFNIGQQRYIEKLIEEECKKNDALKEWIEQMDKEDDTKFFVKNLERVQGDERDVILFSIASGKDENGRVSLNFGPLNKEGGQRRLNVAVSRAKQEMVVFSSVTSDMIKEKKPSSAGVIGLMRFLRYAEFGDWGDTTEEKEEQGVETASQTGKNGGIYECICTELKKQGYEYDINVGKSKFKVDIAVVDPQNPGEYILGILLDGDTYKGAVNTRDREIARVEMLKGLGWNVYRMWTIDFFGDKDSEIKKLIRKLDELKAKSIKRTKPYVPESEEITYTDAIRKVNKKQKEDEYELIPKSEEWFAPVKEYADSEEEREDMLIKEAIEKNKKGKAK